MKWTPEMLDELGKVTDAVFAEKYGINEKAVAQKRNRAGITASNKRANKVEITEEIVWHLGLMHDKDVAEKFGMTFHQVFHARRTRGIASFKAYQRTLNSCPDAAQPSSNVELTGAAPPYGAASSDRRERG